MDQTAEEIRNQEQSTSNEQPAIDDDQGNGQANTDGSASSRSGLPIPSISRKHMIVIGAVVAAVIVWKVYQSQGGSGSSGSESLAEAKDQIEDEQTVEANPDNVEQPRIEVPNDPSDPLAADRAVLSALQSAGTIEGRER